eukprot:3275129-Alexandrium_andersonii.AAC.1
MVQRKARAAAVPGGQGHWRIVLHARMQCPRARATGASCSVPCAQVRLLGEHARRCRSVVGPPARRSARARWRRFLTATYVATDTEAVPEGRSHAVP